MEHRQLALKPGTHWPEGGPTWGPVSVSMVCDILSFICVPCPNHSYFGIYLGALASPINLSSQDPQGAAGYKQPTL